MSPMTWPEGVTGNEVLGPVLSKLAKELNADMAQETRLPAGTPKMSSSMWWVWGGGPPEKHRRMNARRGCSSAPVGEFRCDDRIDIHADLPNCGKWADGGRPFPAEALPDSLGANFPSTSLRMLTQPAKPAGHDANAGTIGERPFPPAAVD